MDIGTRLFTLLILSISAPGYGESSGIEPHLKALIICTTQAYRPKNGEFVVEEFNKGWASCESVRQDLLEQLPPEQQGAWIDKFEVMRKSMIARFQPQPGRDGYGLNQDDPVMIGGLREGPARTRRYFENLRTTNGDSLTVRRTGSCCRFKTPNALIGDHASLDKYELKDGSGNVTFVYVNIYDEGVIKPVVGFKFAQSE